MARAMAVLLVLALGAVAEAQTAPPGFQVDPYGTSLPNGTAMAWSPDGRLFVAQLTGAIRVLKGGTLLPTPFHTVGDVNFVAGAERGLLGMCFDPGFSGNGFLYVYVTVASPAPHNAVRRLHVSAGSDVSDGSETPILDLENLGPDMMHMGGALAFGPDGKLYVGVGDNADANLAPSVNSHFGKILRLNADGSIPADNPTGFAGIAGVPTGAFQSIWAIGLRNPFRFAFQPGSTRMYINDVGRDNWEEIDQGAAGLHFGWDVMERDGARQMPPFTDPVYQYGHMGTVPMGVAITGGVFYPSSGMFPSSFSGKYFFADFAGWVAVLDPASPGSASTFLSGLSGPVDLSVGPDGALYVLTFTGTPGVYRVWTGLGSGASGGTSSCGATGLEPLILLIPLFFLPRLHPRRR